MLRSKKNIETDSVVLFSSSLLSLRHKKRKWWLYAMAMFFVCLFVHLFIDLFVAKNWAIWSYDIDDQ